ncbi:Transcriptional regulator, Fis family [Candidatus Sulfopaludibacter sp. SbA3]|nr:Transcriptional regulator, Fis family [Candidatus Sulfopaludibacter sp. SbA3]
MSRLSLLLIGASLSWGATIPAQFHSQAAGARPDPAVEQWWTSFHDPELDSLIERAVHANLDLKIAASRLLEAKAARGMARADLLPSVEASESSQRVRGGLTQGIFRPNAGSQSSLLAPFETNIFQQGFDASWEIDFFGGKRHALEAATADAAATEEARRDTLVSLLAEVARNYSELRGTQRRLEIAGTNINLQIDTLGLTKVRAEAGLGTELDVERQTSQLAATQATVPALEGARAMSIHRLSVLLGEEPGALTAELSEVKPLPATPPAVPVGLSGDLLKRRPDVRRADAEVAAARARVGVAHSDFFPKITLTGAVGRQGTSFSGLTLGAGNFFAVGPAIKLPIFTGGRLRANMEAQKQRLSQAQLAYQNAVLRSLEETENALTAYGREQERREQLQRAAHASQVATHLANELYTRGLADFLTVLDAQRQQLTVEDDLVQSDTAVVTNLVALYKALGGGWNR